jgi:hypothetical protein
MTALGELAAFLAARGLGSYDSTGAAQTADWSIWPDRMPPTPDKAIGLFQQPGGADPDSANPWHDIRIQVRVRGTADPTVSRARAELIYSALHGLGPVELPGGMWLQLATAITAGVSGLGPDVNDRHEHVALFEITVIEPTDHRPAL